MGYFRIHYPSASDLEKMIYLSCLFYQESHNEKPTDAIANISEQTIVVNGTFTECYGFDQLIEG